MKQFLQKKSFLIGISILLPAKWSQFMKAFWKCIPQNFPILTFKRICNSIPVEDLLTKLYDLFPSAIAYGRSTS